MNRVNNINAILEGLDSRNTITEGVPMFTPRYGCKLSTDFGDQKKGTLYYCSEVNNTNKTVSFTRQDSKSYVITLPIKVAEKIFTTVSGLEENRSYTSKVDIEYTPVEYTEDWDWTEKFITKYTKTINGEEWIVFPKGTKFTYKGQDMSGDYFTVDGQEVVISDIELLNDGKFKEFSDIFKM